MWSVAGDLRLFSEVKCEVSPTAGEGHVGAEQPDSLGDVARGSARAQGDTCNLEWSWGPRVHNPEGIRPDFCLHVQLSFFSRLAVFRTVRSYLYMCLVSPPKREKKK